MFGKKKNPWREHVKDVQRKYPTMSLKDILKLASKTYKKPKKEKKD